MVGLDSVTVNVSSSSSNVSSTMGKENVVDDAPVLTVAVPATDV